MRASLPREKRANIRCELKRGRAGSLARQLTWREARLAGQDQYPPTSARRHRGLHGSHNLERGRPGGPRPGVRGPIPMRADGSKEESSTRRVTRRSARSHTNRTVSATCCTVGRDRKCWSPAPYPREGELARVPQIPPGFAGSSAPEVAELVGVWRRAPSCTLEIRREHD